MPSAKERQRGVAERIAQNRAELFPVLLRGRERLVARISRAAGDKTLSVRAATRNALYRDLRGLYAALEGDLRKWSVKATRRELKGSFEDAKDDRKRAELAADFTGKKLADGMLVTKFSEKYLNEYVERISPYSAAGPKGVAVNAKLSQMAENDVRALRQATVEVFREAAATGMTARERQVELQSRTLQYAMDMRDGEPGTPWSFIDRSGRRWQNGNYFNMVNRTLTANVSRDTYSDAVVEVGGDLVEVIGGSSTHDQVCKAAPEGYVGRILSLTGATEGFETIASAKANGLFHPNCVHDYKVVWPELSSHAERIEEQRGREPVKLDKPHSHKKKQSVKS